ncbi:transglutaminase-like domain-containing protein [Haloimpatiens sp. FM7330]|uniref:transglutaminase-like domain-containing protein n=1 Tax=Haloimpatiens sp. FM7330 TaxID=3298610 RepID=UPI0036399580
MGWIKDKSLTIMLVFINIMFMFKLMEKTLIIQNFDYIFVILFYLISVFIYWLYSSALKKKIYKILSMLSSMIFLGLIIFFQYNIVSNFVKKEFINNYNVLYNLTDKLKPTYFYQFKPFFIVGFVILIPILLAITYKFNNFILIVNLIYIIFMWFLNFTEEVISCLHAYLFISIITYALFLYKRRIKELKKKNIEIRMSKVKMIIYCCILSVIISTVSVLLPQDIKGKYSINLKGIFENKFVSGNGSISSKKLKKNAYSIVNSGYSNSEKKLGGSIKINNKVAFQVRGRGIKYLKGTVRDYYTGYSWKDGEAESFFQKRKDKQIMNVYKLNEEKITNQSLVIYPKLLKTHSFLVPSYTYDVQTERGQVFYNKIPIFIGSHVQDKQYSVKYHLTNLETFEDMKREIEFSDGISNDYSLGNMQYERNREGKTIFIRSDKEENYITSFRFRTFNDTVESQYKKYLQVPKSVPRRVYNLVNSITLNCKNNIEKIENIKKYLEKNYKYSLEVSDVPDGRDFVDYFLFDGRKGYCTYFASSMTIMCRIAGIPSRYVEGFKMSNRMDLSSYNDVTNEQAHAWCEILINSNSNIWTAADPAPTPLEFRIRMNEKKKKDDYSMEYYKNMHNVPLKKQKNSDITKESTELNVNNSTNKFKIIHVLVLLLLILCVTLYLLLYNIKKNKMLEGKSIIPLYEYTLKRLKVIGIEKSAYMGDLEFIFTINDDELRSMLLKIVKIYYDEYYGNEFNNSYNKKEFYYNIEKYIKQKQNKIKYYFKKLLIK